jgi:hypothetical protein
MATKKRILAVSSVGKDGLDYFEATRWQANDGGLVSIIDEATVVGAYSVQNLIAIVDVTNPAFLLQGEGEERVKAARAAK